MIRLKYISLLIATIITGATGQFALATSGPAVEFAFYQNTNHKTDPTLLVIGGIQGDEPGGFNAASILATNYRFHRGNVWIVPNLNFYSILKRSRGVHGDMNRKFSMINVNDPEFSTVTKIKNIILQEQVDVVLNLHDGSGYYRPFYKDKLHNPNRWGQSVIIDQEKINAIQYFELANIANKVIRKVNEKVEDKEHIYHLKNTNTAKGDKEMEKTLTYFAIKHGKPAFGLEVSKQFGTVKRSYYHLLMLEEFMKHLGIEFTRDFPLSYQGVKWALNDNLQLALFGKKVLLDLSDARRKLRFVPIKKNRPMVATATNPLIAILPNKHEFSVRFGNRSMTSISPQFFEFDNSLQKVDLIVDDQEQSFNIGEIVPVSKYFLIKPIDGYRVNVIGFKAKNIVNESGIPVYRRSIISRYSTDNAARIFRVEFYQGSRYCGMILVNYNKNT